MDHFLGRKLGAPQRDVAAPATRWRRRLGVSGVVLVLAGCSYIPFFGSDDFKPGPLPQHLNRATASVAWQQPLGNGAAGLAPVVVGKTVFAAAAEGTLASLDLETGRAHWRIATGTPVTGGVGSDGEVVVVGNAKGRVQAFDAQGKSLWQAQVSSAVLAPPKVSDGMVAVWSGDGRIFGFNAKTGERKWVYQRGTPALTLRNYASGTTHRGGLFTGSAGGKLIAMDLASGAVGWEASVATPKGATELERIADVAGEPIADEQQVCAVAFQGRLACFDILRGTLLWSRDISSHAGIAADAGRIYLTDEKYGLRAVDRSTGSSVWKQDKLAQRRPGKLQRAGEHLAAVDIEGYLHLIDRADGHLIGRLALDGSALAGPAVTLDDGLVVLSRKGLLSRIRVR